MTIDQALESYTRGILESGGWNFEHDLNDRERLVLLAVEMPCGDYKENTT